VSDGRESSDDRGLTDGRESILAGVRGALEGAPGERAREQSPGGAGGGVEPTEMAPTGLIELLRARLLDHGVEVVEARAAEVAGALDRVLTAHDVTRVAVPPGLPASWRPSSVPVADDHGLTAAELDGLDAVVTGCTLAVAETGTLLLTAGPAAGRRVLTLVPDLFVCVVQAADVVADAGAALVAVAPLVRDERRPLTFISGPSATSDIELQRVQGVHGPRRLVVVLVSD